MGARNDKGRALANFIINRSGIPEVRWDAAASTIELPHPLGFDVVTNRNQQALGEAVRRLPEDSLRGVIRYDQYTDRPGAWVIYRLDGASRLVGNYYDTALGSRREAHE